MIGIYTASAVVAAVVAAFVAKKVVAFYTDDLSKVPGPPRSNLILGNATDFDRKDYHKQVLSWSNQYGGLLTIRVLFARVLLVSGPVIAAQVLGTGSNAIPRKSREYKLLDWVVSPMLRHESPSSACMTRAWSSLHPQTLY